MTFSPPTILEALAQCTEPNEVSGLREIFFDRLNSIRSPLLFYLLLKVDQSCPICGKPMSDADVLRSVIGPDGETVHKGCFRPEMKETNFKRRKPTKRPEYPGESR